MAKGILWAVVQDDLTHRVPPRYPRVVGHHVTLCYDCELTVERAGLLGREFVAVATGDAWNDRIQALTVRLPDDVPCQNPQPHLTLSRRADVRDVESNAMLAGDHQIEPVCVPVRLRIEFQVRRAPKTA